jgi:hypothetical protein
MKTKRDPSAAASTSDAGSTKPTQRPRLESVSRQGNHVRVPNWPAALEDPAVVEALKGMVYESYDIAGDSKTATYRPA